MAQNGTIGLRIVFTMSNDNDSMDDDVDDVNNDEYKE